MSFTYTRDIPFATHTPASDQPNMQVNTNTIDDLIQVDHVSFNDAQGGKHNHVTFHNAQSNPTLLNSEAQIYPKTFGTGTTYLETFTATKTNGGSQINGYLPLVKGMAQTSTQAGPYPKVLTITTLNTLSINIATITQTSLTSITVAFTTSLPFATYYVFISRPLGASMTITKNTGNFVIASAAFSIAATPFEFMVI